ncbi:Glutamate receptor ionotropic, NMDA 2B [Aphelenchoides besseyi]|nr:Glutamate receptor ionotropic, NMDA 2B [Aphelenchoides besseyi]
MCGFWCFLLLLSFPIDCIVGQKEGTKQEVTVGLVYQNYAPSKVYDKSFREAIRNINSGLSISSLRRLSERYELKGQTCVLPRGRFYPSHVLSCLCDVLIKNRVAVIVFLTANEDFDDTTSASAYFLTMASESGIPIISWNSDNSGYPFSKNPSELQIIQMAPPIEHQIRAMLSLLIRYRWNRFSVICSKIAGSAEFLKSVETEIKAFEDRSFKLEIVHHEEIDDELGTQHIHRALTALKQSEARIILVYSTAVKMRKLFEVAQNLDLLSSNYLWIGTQSVKGSMNFALSPAQFGMLTVNFHTNSHAMFPPNDDVITTMISRSVKLFATSLSHLNLPSNVTLQSNANCSFKNSSSTSWPLGHQIYEKMKTSFIKGNPYHLQDGQDSFFYTFDANGRLRNSYLTISNLRTRRNKTARESDNFWDKVGEYTNGELKMLEIQWPGDRSTPPEGTEEKFNIRVVTIEEPPFIIVSELDPESKRCPGNVVGGTICNMEPNATMLKCCTGYCVDLLNKLSNDVGFHYSLYRVHDNKWGIKTQNGWNGLIHDLVSHKADLSATSLKMNSERARDISFTVPFLETGIGTIVKIRSGVLSTTAFLEPFDLAVWLLVIFVIIHVAAITIFVFEFVSPRSFNMNLYCPPGHKFSLLRSYWLVWSTLFGASVSTDVPLSAVARSFSLIWSAFGLSFLSVYTANLAAFMITRQTVHNLKGIDDPKIVYAAEQHPPFRYGTVEQGNTHETLKRNYQSLHSYIERNNFFTTNISEGIEALRNEKLDAFIYDAVVLDYQANKASNCEFQTVGSWAAKTGYGFGLPKNSKLLGKINHFMLLYQKRGDFERLQNYWLMGSCVRDSNEVNSSPLGIGNFTSAFILLSIGVAVAILCLGLEYLFVKYFQGLLKRLDPKGRIGLVSMAMGKSVSFTEAVNRVKEWRTRAQSLSAPVFGSPFLKRVSWDLGVAKPNGKAEDSRSKSKKNSRPKSIIRRTTPRL